MFKVFCKNVKDKLLRQIFPVHMPSALAASIWPFKVDMVWIDANHEFAAVRDDILGWMPHVRKGGLICGHDYAMTIWECDASGAPLPGGKVWRTQVKPAVDLLIPDAQLCGKSIWYKFL